MNLRSVYVLAAIAIFLGAGCGSFGLTPRAQLHTPVTSSSMTLTSTAFAQDGMIPEKFTCEGSQVSPPMVFSSIPTGTVSLVLTLVDESVSYDHWILFNLSPTSNGILEGDIPVSSKGVNSKGDLGYLGPCPPNGQHQYLFTLYALTEVIHLSDGATREELLQEIEGKVIQTATLTGVYGSK